MKLSEAIRLNGMTKPQGYGGDSAYSIDAPCAIGGALQSVGRQPKRYPLDIGGAFKIVFELWPWTRAHPLTSPLDPKEGKRAVMEIIWILNDSYKWSRNQIADWVETVEPLDVAVEATPQLEEALV